MQNLQNHSSYNNLNFSLKLQNAGLADNIANEIAKCLDDLNSNNFNEFVTKNRFEKFSNQIINEIQNSMPKDEFQAFKNCTDLHIEIIRDDLKEFKDEIRTEINLIRTDLKEFKIEIRMNMENFKIDIHKDIKEFKDEIRAEINLIRIEMKEFKIDIRKDMQEFKEDIRKDMKEFKEEIYNVIEKLKIEFSQNLKNLELNLTVKLGMIMATGIGIVGLMTKL
ncbi:MAG: hypothetical protein ACKO6C_06680 [Alphaproteobacteria bacterium]